MSCTNIIRSYLKCDTTNAEVIETIKTKIANEERFSLVRFGDGDVSLFVKGVRTPMKRKLCENWGYEYQSNLQQATDADMLELADFNKEAAEDVFRIYSNAIMNADIIGFLDIVDKGNKAQFKLNVDFKTKLSCFLFKHDLAHSLGYDSSKHRICDHQIMRRRNIGEITAFRDILQGKPIHIISTRTNELKENRIEELLKAGVTYTDVDINETLKWSQENLDRFLGIKEKVILFANGAGGKNIGGFLKKQLGAICLDIGATLDTWGGLITRKSIKGKQKYLVVKNKQSI